MDQLTQGLIQGGGPLESIYRIVTHLGPTVDLPPNPAFVVVRYLDAVATAFVIPCVMLGFFALRSRELESK